MADSFFERESRRSLDRPGARPTSFRGLTWAWARRSDLLGARAGLSPVGETHPQIQERHEGRRYRPKHEQRDVRGPRPTARRPDANDAHRGHEKRPADKRDVLGKINRTPVGRRRNRAEQRGDACGDRPHAASLRGNHDIQRDSTWRATPAQNVLGDERFCGRRSLRPSAADRHDRCGAIGTAWHPSATAFRVVVGGLDLATCACLQWPARCGSLLTCGGV